MGSACCVAAREKTIHGENTGSSLHFAYSQNTICSPSWSLQWDDRSHVGSRTCSSPQFHLDALSNATSTVGESKGDFALDTLSNGESSIRSFQTSTWPKSPVSFHAVDDFSFGGLDITPNPSVSIKASRVVKDSLKRSAVEAKLETNSVASGSFPLKCKNDPSSSRSPVVAPNSTPSRKARRSPGHPLSRQISDSRILSLKSLESTTSEERPSFVLSVGSNDMTLGSEGGSLDGWSMRTFSELVASSRRERWSFESENFVSNPAKIIRSRSMHLSSSSSSMDFHSCGLCLKSIVDKSPWRSGTDVPIVAVLVCGHVYHTDCLESTTSDAEKFDPQCPACTSARKMPLKISPSKALRVELDSRGRHKISRIAVADGDFQKICYPGTSKGTRRDGKGPKTVASSSKGGSFSKPFLKRHFLLGSRLSRPSRTPFVNDSAHSKGFWARYFRE